MFASISVIKDGQEGSFYLCKKSLIGYCAAALSEFCSCEHFNISFHAKYSDLHLHDHSSIGLHTIIMEHNIKCNIDCSARYQSHFRVRKEKVIILKKYKIINLTYYQGKVTQKHHLKTTVSIRFSYRIHYVQSFLSLLF